MWHPMSKFEVDSLKDKIRGALYGFVIGDAMGATTELMRDFEIREKFGEVNDIIGGGWMNLKPGDATGNTQLMLAVMMGIRNARRYDSLRNWYLLKGYVFQEIAEVVRANPTCMDYRAKQAIELQSKGYDLVHDRNVLDNGSLLRALPLALMGPTFILHNIGQGSITHNNNKCSRAIIEYHELICSLVYGVDYIIRQKDFTKYVHEPSVNIVNTWSNGLYWSNKESFRESLIGPVNHGGVSASIAALSGSIAGARFGHKGIPKEWIRKINQNIKCSIELYTKMVLRYLQNKENVIQ